MHLFNHVQYVYPLMGILFGVLFYLTCRKYIPFIKLPFVLAMILCVSWAVIGYLYVDYHRNPTTGISNKAAFTISLQTGLQNKKQLTLVMVDVDHFKRVNDTYGHNVGDEVLKKLSVLLQHHIHSQGKIFHWGGDEFALILDSLTEKEAINVAETIRRAVSSRTDLHGVTISAGVATSEYKETSEKLIHKADKALYEAKKTRNKVVTFPF